jgi:hypothetical protein
MSRTFAFVGLALALAANSLIAAAKKPPSSLQNPGAVLRFGHSHERVLSCKFQPSTKTCVERRGPAAAGATLSLLPVEGRLVSQPHHERVPTTISLPNREGQSAQEVRVESGAWSLSWLDQQLTFRVEPQRNFGVQLKTVSGACVFEGGLCARHDEVVVRNVAVPAEFLGNH